MAKKQEKLTVPLKIQGRGYTGTGSIKEIVLYILECALKDNRHVLHGRTGDDLVIR